MKRSIWKSKWFWITLTVCVIFVVCIIIAAGTGGGPGAKFRMAEDAIQSTVVTGKSGSGGGMNMPSSAAVPEMVSQTTDSAKVSSQEPSWGASKAAMKRMVITTANVTLEVKNLNETYKTLREITVKANGYITQSNMNLTEGERTGTMTIRLPVTGYEQALEAIRKLGKVLSNSETGDDVTEEYVDLQSRIKNLRIEEATFQALMKNVKKMQDIITIESQLSRIRGEIEQVTGRMKFLDNQVSLSTINITYSEPVPSVKKVIDWNISRSANGALNALTAIGRALVTLVIWIVIVFVPIGLVLFVIFKIFRRMMRKKKTSEPE
ncbi:MAG: DUF4349 domain-containing protein [Armatimonadota bacterium]